MYIYTHLDLKLEPPSKCTCTYTKAKFLIPVPGPLGNVLPLTPIPSQSQLPFLHAHAGRMFAHCTLVLRLTSTSHLVDGLSLSLVQSSFHLPPKHIKFKIGRASCRERV